MDFFKIKNEDNLLCLCCLALILYLIYIVIFDKKLIEGLRSPVMDRRVIDKHNLSDSIWYNTSARTQWQNENRCKDFCKKDYSDEKGGIWKGIWRPGETPEEIKRKKDFAGKGIEKCFCESETVEPQKKPKKKPKKKSEVSLKSELVDNMVGLNDNIDELESKLDEIGANYPECLSGSSKPPDVLPIVKTGKPLPQRKDFPKRKGNKKQFLQNLSKEFPFRGIF